MEPDRIKEILSHYPEVNGNLIEILYEIQTFYNFLPEDALRRLSKETGIPATRLYSIAAFYHFFSLVPRGRHKVCVCLGTACHVKGSQRILDDVKRKLGVEEGETTGDMKYTADAVRCIGTCSLAPVMVVDKDIYSGVTAKKVSEILKKYD